MRTALDALYRLAGALAATSLVIIALMVAVQVLGRIIDGARAMVGLDPYGLLVPSLAEIAGFLLAAASFLALASTLRHGVHIRVNILLQQLPDRVARFLEIWVLGVATFIMGYFAWNAFLMVLDSYTFHEVSFGIIPVPLWIPQGVMTAGLAVFVVSLLDDLVMALLGREPSYFAAEREASVEGME